MSVDTAVRNVMKTNALKTWPLLERSRKKLEGKSRTVGIRLNARWQVLDLGVVVVVVDKVDLGGQ